MTFGRAIEALKEGQLVSRSKARSRGIFVFQRPSDTLDRDTVINKVKSLPQKVKDYFAAVSQDKIYFAPYLCLKTEEGIIINGWLPSQEDILAEDWEIFVP
jgi:Protein of unknown function (DUF2829)